MKLRFKYQRYVAVEDSDEDSAWATGVITTAQTLIDEKKLSKSEIKIAKSIFAFLNKNLPCPPFEENTGKWSDDAVCWFRVDSKLAQPVMAETQKLFPLLTKHGWLVKTISTNRPGRIRYRDKFQVVAETT